MAKIIKISLKKRDARAKQAQIEVCWKQRDEQVRKYQSRNPFSYHEWLEAFKCGWLRQHNIGYWDFPSPTAHFRQLWENSKDPWFSEWRANSNKTQKEFIKALKKRRK